MSEEHTARVGEHGGEDAMAGFLGADTDQLREHAELMRDRARPLEGTRTRVSMLVAYGAEWEGEDAEAFRERWRSEIAPSFDERVSGSPRGRRGGARGVRDRPDR